MLYSCSYDAAIQEMLKGTIVYKQYKLSYNKRTKVFQVTNTYTLETNEKYSFDGSKWFTNRDGLRLTTQEAITSCFEHDVYEYTAVYFDATTLRFYENNLPIDSFQKEFFIESEDNMDRR